MTKFQQHWPTPSWGVFSIQVFQPIAHASIENVAGNNLHGYVLFLTSKKNLLNPFILQMPL